MKLISILLCVSLCQGETVDSFNWGARRRSIDSLDRVEQRILEEDENQQSGGSSSLRPTARHDSDESSEEDSLTVSQILASSQLVSQNLIALVSAKHYSNFTRILKCFIADGSST